MSVSHTLVKPLETVGGRVLAQVLELMGHCVSLHVRADPRKE